MRSILRFFCAAFLLALPCFADTIHAMAQRRVVEADSGTRVVQEPLNWEAGETAIVVCDMWDRHWCPTATARVAEMAPRMDEVLRAARERGVLIIHAPSSVTGFYDGTVARDRVRDVPHSDMPNEDSWKHLIPEKEGALPIDDSDGGCDTPMPKSMVNKNVWSRQIETIHISDSDYITDNGQEVYNILEHEGRDNVIVMGVHTNMCVLGRPFSIRANVMNGKNVALMRDLTDSMYNPAMAPRVSHFRGTELVIEHIETFWCATISSSAIDGQPAHRFANDDRPHAVFLLHEDEYDMQATVPAFAEEHLVGALEWKCTYLFGHELNELDGLEAVADADVMVVGVRRQLLPQEDLAMIRSFCESGRPVVGIRTASHAFSPRDGNVPAGHESWEAFDSEILGGNYTGHYGNKSADGPKTIVRVVEPYENDPVFEGIEAREWVTRSWLYKAGKLRDERTGTPLLLGEVEGTDQQSLAAWWHTGKYGNRVFYTSLGHPEDFEDPNFVKMLRNALVTIVSADE